MSASARLMQTFGDRDSVLRGPAATRLKTMHSPQERRHSPLASIAFGPFRLFPAERRLTRDGVLIPLGSRALDILVRLLQQAGHVVTKQELMAHAWPGMTVEEGNLRVHIASLRKALGEGKGGARYIANCTGRGYSFVAPTARQDAQDDHAPAPEPVLDGSPSLPRPLTRLVGREGDVRAISELLAARRFVTLRGPGGIGKTRTALAVAHLQSGDFEHGSSFLDLSLLAVNGSVPEALASALGLAVQSGDPTPAIIEYLRERHLLLFLDCCEHVIESVANLAETIFHEAPQVSILATSREPLRADGEYGYALAPLQMPPAGVPLRADDLPKYPAARLFLERAIAGGHTMDISDDDARIIADICRKVDGIALALELTAGRISALGLRGTAALLDSQIQLSWRGRRTALPRHQSLQATLDWSHDLISEPERVVLRRLSVFAGPFTLDEAQAVGVHGSIDRLEIVDALAQLVSKSLVLADTSEQKAFYRLLGTTRAYARSKLDEAGEEADTMRRHAMLCSEKARSASAEPASSMPRIAGTSLPLMV